MILDDIVTKQKERIEKEKQEQDIIVLKQEACSLP